jgi:hypothetical protein
MVLSPEERSEINKRNASRARGPVTEAGKNKSKYNALKHGGRAETLVLPNEDPVKAQALHDHWHGFYTARSPAEAAYLDKIVRSLRKAERLRRAEDQTLDVQVRAAELNFDAKQEEQVESLVATLKEDPASAIRGLRRTAAGCRWLLERWNDLKDELDDRGAWVASNRMLATRLQGLRPEACREDEMAFLTRSWNVAAQPHRDQEGLDRLLEPTQIPDTLRSEFAGREPMAEPSRALLFEMVAEHLAELTGREEHLRTTIEEPARAGAADRAMVLEGEEGRRLHRYQVTAENDYHRAYSGFLKARAREEGLVDLAPLPNEPNPAVATEPSPLPNEPNPPSRPDPTPSEPATSDESPSLGPDADDPPATPRAAEAPLPNEPKSAPAPACLLGEIAVSDPSGRPVAMPFAVGIAPGAAPPEVSTV